MNYTNQFLFGIYPYLAITVFLVGSLIRFDREQYTWKSESSQLLDTGLLRFGSPLFHIGVLGLFFGHFAGLLTPLWIWHGLGVTHGAKQLVAMGAGGLSGACCLIGLVLLLARRFSNPRVRAQTSFGDKLVLLWLLTTLLLGLSSIYTSSFHLDGHTMVLLMSWAQYIITFDGGAAGFIETAPLVFKLHVFMGMTLFVIFPFTRLVHVWSGFGALAYLGRAYQLVRSR